MPVQRVSPGPTPYRRDLGRLLITIDDLRALVQILTDAASAGGTPDVVQLSFEGGTFSDPVELKELTDAELRTIRVATSQIHVILNADGATAVGDQDLVDLVNDSWAGMRGIDRAISVRVRDYTAGSSNAYLRHTDEPSGSGCGCWVLLLLLATGGYGLMVTTGIFDYLLHPLVAAFVWSLILLLSVPTLTRAVAIRIKPVRVRVVPQTLAEYRGVGAADRIPRLAWIVSIVAVLIAIIAIVVPILTSK